MGRLSGFTYREVARRFRSLGFEFDRQGSGSHEIWRNAETGAKATLVNHPGDMKEGTLRSILKAAAIDVDRFLSG